MEKKTKKRESSCEDCVFYDYDEDWDTYSCQMNLDEDEMVRFLTQKHQSCPYYRYYDEDWDTYSCQMNLDEDEMVRFLTQKHQSCPYYRYYDEYKSVQKQN